jgi:NAD+ synthase
MTPFSKNVLQLDCAAEVARVSAEIRKLLASFRRRGVIVALSGGIDSSVTAALSVQAVGKDRVFGIHMPDRDSSPETLALSQSISTHFGFDSTVEDITPILEAAGCYSRQIEAIRKVVPEYAPGWKSKIVLENALTHTGYNYFHVVVQSPSGQTTKHRLPLESYLGIVAATNFKQRVRKMFDYYHADRLNYAVSGTPNRLEYDQGFFVKLGDGAADFKPIAHLYKTQVYQLAEYLGVPAGVRQRPPTTDTYSLPQGQDEFYFALPYDKLDLCLYAKNNNVSSEAVAALLGLTREQVEKVFADIEMKRSTTRYLHLKPQLVGPVPELNL